jgi:uroporphyrinogen decarboxylase
MNSLERVMNTLQGKPVDRVPVISVLSAYGARLTGIPLKTHYSDPYAYVAGQTAVKKAFGLDALLAPFDYSALSEAFGGEVAWFDNQAPNVRRPAAGSLTAALDMDLPDPRKQGRLPFVLESVRRLADLHGDESPVFSAIPSPSALCALLLGLEGWLEAFLFDMEKAETFLEKTGRFFLDWGNALFDSGLTGLIMTEPFTVKEIVPREMFELRILPQLIKLLPGLKGPLVFHHSGGRINPVADLLPGLPKVIGVAVSSADKLDEAREKIGPGTLLLGNLDNLSFPSATPEKIRERALKRLRTAVGHGPYILATSGADIPLTTPPENILALRLAAEEFAGGTP